MRLEVQLWIARAQQNGKQQLEGYLLQENPRDGAAWWAAVYGVAQSRTQLKRLSSSSSSSRSAFTLALVQFRLMHPLKHTSSEMLSPFTTFSLHISSYFYLFIDLT